jgi:hypothetical protein
MQRFLPALRPRTWLILAGLLVLAGLLLPLDVIHGESLLDGEGPIRKFLFVLILNLTGWFLWLGGAILDYGVNAFVINFGTNFNKNGVGVAVNQLWVIVRDFFNIFFIFGLVYIGFKMILNSDDSQTKKTLVYLIMAALLINFSLFITKFVVDFTNVLAGEVAVAGFAAAVGEGTKIDGNARNKVAIGDTFFRLMGISQNVLLTPNGVAENEVQPWSYIFGIGIINIIGAFAFGVGGIMLIIRFVALSVYMVLSPFMFLGWIFPGFQSMSSKYWSGFLKQAFYAPVYIVMIFFAATILNNFFRTGGSFQNANMGALANTESGLLGAVGGAGALGGSAGAAVQFGGGLAPFILSAAFLIAAVQVAGKLSADGSTVMGKVGGAVQSRVRGAIRGTGRFAARNTLGYGARGAGLAGEAGRRRLNRLTSSMAQSDRFGARTLARGLDGSVGAGLDTVARARVAGSETAAEKRTRIDAAQVRFNNTATENQRATDLTAARAALAAASIPADRKTAENKIKKLTGKMSTAELQNLAPAELKTLMESGLVNSTKMKELAGTGQFSNAYMKAAGKKREEALFGDIEKVFAKSNATAIELTTAIEDLSKEIEAMTDEEKSNVDFNRLNSQVIASQLSEKSMDSIRDSGNLTSSEFSDLKKTRTAGIQNILATGRIGAETRDTNGKVISATPATVSNTPGTTDAAAFVKKQQDKLVKGNAETIGRLPYEAFFNTTTGILTDAGRSMTVDAMKAIARTANLGRGSMSADERSDLAKAVRLHNGTTSKMAAYLATQKAKEDFLL